HTSEPSCPIHTYALHNLDACRQFRNKPFEERKQFLKDNHMCFKFCTSNSAHLISMDCTVSVKCSECGSSKHTTALHISRNIPTEDQKGAHNPQNIPAKCAKLCSDSNLSK
ncbi:LOW QUALITY PROTEIN: hypothetical protein MAR_018882, partial [Mya arenaria]